MRRIFCILILIGTGPAWSCLQPTPSELFHFFEGERLWTEVKAADSRKIAEKRPVFLQIPFENPKDIQVRWGDNLVGGEGLSICWAEPERRRIIIRKRFFQSKLVKVEPGLLKSWIPVDGDLYYRKDSEVVKETELRLPAEKDNKSS